MQAIVDQLAVNYELTGKGKVVLLLHGWGDNHQTFSSLVSLLSSNFQLLAPDLPGFGASQAPKEPWNLDNYSKLVADLMAKLELKPYAIIGHSNGGALAMRGLSHGDFDSEKLILLASAGVRNSQPAKRFLTKVIAKVGKVATIGLPKEARNRLRVKLYGSIGSDLLVRPELSETFKLSVRQDVQADAAKLKLPTLIINSDQDPAIPLKDAKLFNELIKGSKLEVIKGKSHFVHQEYADQVNQLISNFL